MPSFVLGDIQIAQLEALQGRISLGSSHILCPRDMTQIEVHPDIEWEIVNFPRNGNLSKVRILSTLNIIIRRGNDAAYSQTIFSEVHF